MTDLTPYDFDGAQVRVLLRDGDPWFVAADVATALGYARPNDAVAQHVDDEDRATTANDRGGPDRIIINESGLYALVFGSKLPAAKRFKRWVTSEVLPAIRKTGSYAMPEPGSDADLDRVEAMIAAVRADRARLAGVESRTEVIESQLAGVLGSYDEFTALGFAKLRKLPTDRPFLASLGRAASAWMRSEGREPRKRQDATFGEVGVYPIEALDYAARQIA